jgi:hypothetical protein
MKSPVHELSEGMREQENPEAQTTPIYLKDISMMGHVSTLLIFCALDSLQCGLNAPVLLVSRASRVPFLRVSYNVVKDYNFQCCITKLLWLWTCPSGLLA